MTHTKEKEKESWEKEFDELDFVEIDEYGKASHIDGEKVKDFIRKVASNAYTQGQLNAGFDAAKLLAHQERALREEIAIEVEAIPQVSTQIPALIRREDAASLIRNPLKE